MNERRRGLVAWFGWFLSLRSIMARCAHNPPQENKPNQTISPQKQTQFIHFFGFSSHSQEMKNCFVCFFGLPRGVGPLGAAFHSFHSIVIHKFKFFISFQTLNLFISFHFIHFTHKLLGCARLFRGLVALGPGPQP